MQNLAHEDLIYEIYKAILKFVKFVQSFKSPSPLG